MLRKNARETEVRRDERGQTNSKAVCRAGMPLRSRRRLPVWMREGGRGGAPLLLRLPVEILERVATCSTGGRLEVGWGLAVACRRTREASQATRGRWAACSSCRGPLSEGNHRRCTLCEEPICESCHRKEEGLCAESLHDVAETPVVCRGCRGGLPVADWTRCQHCFRLLCPVCRVTGLPAFQLCDDCCYPFGG